MAVSWVLFMTLFGNVGSALSPTHEFMTMFFRHPFCSPCFVYYTSYVCYLRRRYTFIRASSAAQSFRQRSYLLQYPSSMWRAVQKVSSFLVGHLIFFSCVRNAEVEFSCLSMIYCMALTRGFCRRKEHLQFRLAVNCPTRIVTRT